MSACAFCGSRGGRIDLIISLLSVYGASAQPMEILYSWPFHIMATIDNDHLTQQIRRQTLLPCPSDSSNIPDPTCMQKVYSRSNSNAVSSKYRGRSRIFRLVGL